jgi:hypothetical protein
MNRAMVVVGVVASVCMGSCGILDGLRGPSEGEGEGEGEACGVCGDTSIAFVCGLSEEELDECLPPFLARRQGQLSNEDPRWSRPGDDCAARADAQVAFHAYEVRNDTNAEVGIFAAQHTPGDERDCPADLFLHVFDSDAFLQNLDNPGEIGCLFGSDFGFFDNGCGFANDVSVPGDTAVWVVVSLFSNGEVLPVDYELSVYSTAPVVVVDVTR